jgi:hypothetical protein
MIKKIDNYYYLLLLGITINNDVYSIHLYRKSK